MQNRNLQQQIRIAQSKIEQKKQQFHDVQTMELNIIRDNQKNGWEEEYPFENRQQRIEKYLEIRNNAELRHGDQIEPIKYSLAGLTIQECRAFHERLKQKKILYRQEIKTTDTNYLNESYWKMYGDFMKESSINQQNAHLMSHHIAQMKGMISILDNRPNFENIKICTKQHLDEAALFDLQRRYEKLEKRVKDKEIDGLDITEVMNKAKRYFETQYGAIEQNLQGSSIRQS